MGFSMTYSKVSAIVGGELLLDDVSLNGHPDMVSLTREVS